MLDAMCAASWNILIISLSYHCMPVYAILFIDFLVPCSLTSASCPPWPLACFLPMQVPRQPWPMTCLTTSLSTFWTSAVTAGDCFGVSSTVQIPKQGLIVRTRGLLRLCSPAWFYSKTCIRPRGSTDQLQWVVTIVLLRKEENGWLLDLWM